MLTNLIVVIIFHYIRAWNHPTAHLTFTQCYIYQLYLNKAKIFNFSVPELEETWKWSYMDGEGLTSWAAATKLTCHLSSPKSPSLWISVRHKEILVLLVLFSVIIVCVSVCMYVCIFLLIFCHPSLDFKLQEVRNIPVLFPLVYPVSSLGTGTW